MIAAPGLAANHILSRSVHRLQQDLYSQEVEAQTVCPVVLISDIWSRIYPSITYQYLSNVELVEMPDASYDIDSESGIFPPIELETIETSQFILYLSGRVPISTTELSDRCKESEGRVSKLLQERFGEVTDVDATGFVTLSSGAHSVLISEIKPHLARAKRLRAEAVDSRQDDELDEAVERYRRANAILSVVRDRLTAVNGSPDAVRTFHEQLQQEHDDIRKTRVKDTLNYQLLVASQHEDVGDTAVNESRHKDATSEFAAAVAALETAQDAVVSYNEARLADESPQLDLDPLSDRINRLEEKWNEVAEKEDKLRSGGDSDPDLSDEPPEHSDDTTTDTTVSHTLTRPEIPDNERLDEPFVVRVREVHDRTSEDSNKRLTVEDVTGATLTLRDWDTHELEIDWKVDHWYRLREARGKVWERDNTVVRNLSSTADMVAEDLGTDPVVADAPATSKPTDTDTTVSSAQPDPPTVSSDIRNVNSKQEETVDVDSSPDISDPSERIDALLSDIESATGEN